MHLMKWGLKPRSRNYIACLLALIMSLSLIGLGNPGTVMAKTTDSPPAESLVVNINDNGEIIPIHTYTMAEMQALSGSVAYYSSIDSMPAPVITIAQGVTLNNLVADINSKYNANVTIGSSTLNSIRLHSTDSWSTEFTYDYLFGATRSYYPKLVETWDGTNNKTGAGCSDNPSLVDPMFAVSSYQARNLTNLDSTQMVGPTDTDSVTFRFCFGQTADDITNSTITTGRFGKWVNRMDINLPDGPDAPTLTPDSTDNTVGNAAEITFTDDGTWQNAVSIVRVNDVDLTPDQYTKTAGKITIAGTVFTETKDYSVYVKASNYKAATVTQTINQAQVQADLIVDGPAVAQSKSYTVAQLKSLEKDTSWPPAVTDKKPVIQSKYSAIDAGGRHNKYSAEGVRVKYLLEQAGVQPGYGKVIFHSSDGWTTVLTEENINDAQRYYYPYDASLQPVAVEPMLAYQSGKWTTQEADLTQMWAESPLRLFLGQYPETEVNNNNFAKKVVRMEVGELPLSPLVLTADSTDNTVGNPIDITFTENEAWRNAITEVKVDDTVLDGSKYTRTEAGKITIASDVFTAAKDYNIVVKAANYSDASVTQTVQAQQAAIVFTIDGDAVAAKTYTMADLQAMSATEASYPAKTGTVNCKGVALKDLLTNLNISDGSLIAQINITDAATFPIDPVTVADLLNADNAYLLTYLMDGGAVTGETPLRIYKAAPTPKTATIKNVFGITINKPVNPSSPPALTADSTGNKVGSPIDITFTEDQAWRNAITEVKVDSTVLDGAKYTRTEAGKITLDASVFTAAGSYTITIKADGYQDASLTQTVNNEYATTALVIKVDNGSPVTVTAEQIKALNPNNTLRYYSFAKDGKMNYYTGLGAPLAAILSQYVSLNSSDVQSMTVKAADYYRTFEDPQNELFGTRYYYPAAGDRVSVESIIAADAQDYATDDIGKLDNTNTMRLMMGQSSADERTNSWMVKWVCEIDITTFAATNVPVSGVSLNKTETSLVINKSEQLTANITPAGATNKLVSWKSDKDAVATVDSTGKVTAVGEGKAVITATTADGSFTSSCTVTVLLVAPPAVYTLTPVENDVYSKGTTPDGIWTMTVNPGNTGLKYFSVLIAPVVAHDGKETMVFTHLRDGAQLELNATEADFDVVDSAQAGFNVQAGDVIKVYPVDRLSNDGTNPFILQ
ncbi:MAG: hemoblobin-interacting domain-containing protein [Syntrophomonas sp.]